MHGGGDCFGAVWGLVWDIVWEVIEGETTTMPYTRGGLEAFPNTYEASSRRVYGIWHMAYMYAYLIIYPLYEVSIRSRTIIPIYYRREASSEADGEPEVVVDSDAEPNVPDAKRARMVGCITSFGVWEIRIIRNETWGQQIYYE